MNQYIFDLIAQHRPEVLERVLRVIRLRGFTVTNMNMALVETQVQLKITVKSDRTFDLLVNQLAKLPDVLNIIICNKKGLNHLCLLRYFFFLYCCTSKYK